jgi:hypothetical protein
MKMNTPASGGRIHFTEKLTPDLSLTFLCIP